MTADIQLTNVLVYRNGSFQPGTVTVENGLITSVTEANGASPKKLLVPGGIDIHVHFNEPGRTDWEGIANGSKALAAGGMTAFADMPLNSSPPTATAERVLEKKRLFKEKSRIHGSCWGALLPGHVDDLEAMKAAGIIGVKAFMSPSGLDEFASAGEELLLEGMTRMAELDLILAVHAESPAVLQRYQNECGSYREFAASRPPEAEREAVSSLLSYAAKTGCAVHICHVTCAEALEEIRRAKRHGVHVTAETCPHYLFFTGTEAETKGTLAKCAPPIRGKRHQDALWEALLDGTLDLVSSDHSPAPPAMKDVPFRDAWGGIAGGQHTWHVLLTEGKRRGIAVETMVPWVTRAPAERFRLENPVEIAPGNPADMALLDPDVEWTMTREDARHRHPESIYTGARFTGRVEKTWVHGEEIAGAGVPSV
ncbi:allantoinase AllB [Alkalicoccus urumqiensis]|nr:allantoinase AllB [Alkalicoccus urumqiensis]